MNAVNYLTGTPPQAVECCYEEDASIVNDQTGSFRPNVQVSNTNNWCQGQGNKVRIMEITIEKASMSRMGTITVNIIIIGTSMGLNDWVETYVPPQNLLLGMLEVTWHILMISFK